MKKLIALISSEGQDQYLRETFGVTDEEMAELEKKHLKSKEMMEAIGKYNKVSEETKISSEGKSKEQLSKEAKEALKKGKKTSEQVKKKEKKI